MKRRGFLKRIAFTGAAVVVAPTVLTEPIVQNTDKFLMVDGAGTTKWCTYHCMGHIFKVQHDPVYDLLGHYGNAKLDDMLHKFPTKTTESYRWDVINFGEI